MVLRVIPTQGCLLLHSSSPPSLSLQSSHLPATPSRTCAAYLTLLFSLTLSATTGLPPHLSAIVFLYVTASPAPTLSSSFWKTLSSMFSVTTVSAPSHSTLVPGAAEPGLSRPWIFVGFCWSPTSIIPSLFTPLNSAGLRLRSTTTLLSASSAASYLPLRPAQTVMTPFSEPMSTLIT